jgi:two-component system, NarL family, nitrate/nitrite response regulator NarL
VSYRIAVIDDHVLLRDGLVDVLAAEPDFEVVGVGGSADDACAIAQGGQLDLIFLDVNMPGTGVLAASRIRAELPGLAIIFLSFRQDLEVVKACMAQGAQGYVVKGVSGPELVGIARKVLAGERHLDPKLVHAQAEGSASSLQTLGDLVGSEAWAAE